MKHPLDKVLSRYRYWSRKRNELEHRFDCFVRANRDNEQLRQEYAKKANKEYFAIKSRLESIRAEYRILRDMYAPLGALCALKR